VKNIYGCFPSTNKIIKYHVKLEVPEVTARSLRNFPVHFSFVDAWVGSDGFQGYKIANPKELKMLFGGNEAVAVDMEIFKRAGIEPGKSKILKKAAEQLYDGKYPEYVVKGDLSSKFKDITEWENISDEIVEKIDVMEEVYLNWGLINLKPIAEVVDFNLFPPKNIFYRCVILLSKFFYKVLYHFKFYKKLYQ
jgi:uncharacterized protein (DUF362 family)